MTTALFSVIALGQSPLPQVSPWPGMTITSSCQVKPGIYALKGGNSESSAGLVIRGNNITVDLTGVTFEGTPKTAAPDARKGYGISVVGSNVTIRGGKVRGYKVAIIARKSDKFKVFGTDLSYNWRQRLKSTPEKEDLADWMSYHKNEEDEWLRFGASIYLSDVNDFEIKNVRALGGQCGLMMTRSNNGLIWNNNMSYLSAVGLGMYRSSNNRIMHNKFDYCVRGYSHGVYNRGQDSTGILIYEQSNKNVFAYNSATHGGDGFFLWAGQHTMDTGQGGCNDNVVWGNDFSHSPANAIEATFSRNVFANNLLIDCWHGVWGGYSYDSHIVGNIFGLNGEAIAIEHGQNNRIIGNRFFGDTLGIYLWQNAGAPDPNWGYPKHRDTRNRDNYITNNQLTGISDVALSLGTGTNYLVANNLIDRSKRFARFDGAPLTSRMINNQIAGPTESLEQEGFEFERNTFTGASFDAPPVVISRGGNSFPAHDSYVRREISRLVGLWNPYENPQNTPIPARPTFESTRASVLRPNYVAPLKGGVNPFLLATDRRGRNTMIIDEWGPYDYLSPKLVVKSKSIDPATQKTVYVFQVLGPFGKWSAGSIKGMTLEERSGEVPGLLIAKTDLDASDLQLNLVYLGNEVTDYRGIVYPKGTHFPFSWSKFLLQLPWQVKWFAYDKEAQEPRTQQTAFLNLLNFGKAIKTELTTELNYSWSGALGPNLPSNHFATLATCESHIPKGTYTLSVTSDDGVRVYVDGKKVLEDWTWHAPKSDSVELKLGGKHTFRVEHFEIDGFSTLKVELVPKRSSPAAALGTKVSTD